MAEEAIRAQDVRLRVLEQNTGNELAERLHFECEYCGKLVSLHIELAKLHKALNDRQFYCNFCLRHKLYTKHSRHILMLSFRAIIGYYYHAFYRSNFASQQMYFSQIREYVETHAATGLQNPVFFYDPDTFVWFVDFSRVGRGRGKVAMTEVLKTVSNILACFNLPMHLANVRMFDVYDKYRDSIERFYSQRNRPEGRRLLAPTLSGCGAYENHQGFTMDDTRNFTATQFVRVD